MRESLIKVPPAPRGGREAFELITLKRHRALKTSFPETLEEERKVDRVMIYIPKGKEELYDAIMEKNNNIRRRHALRRHRKIFLREKQAG